MANNMIDVFNEYFEMVPAISDELKLEVYKLRYQVFCIDNEIFDSENYPDELEFDDYDRHSVHYLIRHRKSGDYAATARLILPDANNPEKLFPLELHCEIDDFAVMQPINRKHLGEISRLCVSKAFKIRKNEAHTLAAIGPEQQGYFTPDERRTFLHISLALMACIIKASHENDIHYTYAAMEPPFVRFLSALGINAIKVGPLADYHGNRWPTLIKGTDMLDHLAEKNLDIWNFLTNKGCYLQAGPIVEKQNHLFGTIRKLQDEFTIVIRRFVLYPLRQRAEIDRQTAKPTALSTALGKLAKINRHRFTD